MIRLFLALAMLLFTVGCVGGPQIQAPQEISYKDVVHCKKVEAKPEFSDCLVKVGDTGVSFVQRIQTSKVPEDKAE